MNLKTLPLNKLYVGQNGRVIGLISEGNERRRMMDLGIVEGTKIQVVLRSHSGDPMAYLIRGAVIALRNKDASTVLIQKV